LERHNYDNMQYRSIQKGPAMIQSLSTITLPFFEHEAVLTGVFTPESFANSRGPYGEWDEENWPAEWETHSFHVEGVDLYDFISTATKELRRGALGLESKYVDYLDWYIGMNMERIIAQCSN